MAGRSVSGYVDEGVAARLGVVAHAGARTPAGLVGQATSFYVGLPEVARSALRRIEQTASPEERSWFEGELVRLLLRTNFALTQRVMAAEVAHSLPRGDSDAEIDQAADEWLGPARP